MLVFSSSSSSLRAAREFRLAFWVPERDIARLCMETDVVESLGLHKLLAWYYANRKQVHWGAALVAAAGLIIWFVVWQQEAKQEAASEALSDVAIKQMSGPNSAAAAAEGYLKVANSYPNSTAGEQALLLAAGDLFTEGKYDQARTEFDRFRREHPQSALVPEAMLGVGACWDAQGKTSEAMAAYKELIARRNAELEAPQAKFALARLYEAQNNWEAARTLFEEVARQPYSSLGSEAGMRLEELQMKHPSLPPAPPMSTNVSPTFQIEKNK